MSYDVLGVLNKYYDMQPARPDDQALQDWGVTEKITTAYGKLGIDTDLGPIPCVARWACKRSTSTRNRAAPPSTAAQWAASAAAPNYTDWLPSLNLNFDLDKYLSTTNLRFGAAKTVARPQMSDMRAGVSGGVDTTTRMWNGSGGNPNLEPWRANSYDCRWKVHRQAQLHRRRAVVQEAAKLYLQPADRVQLCRLPESVGSDRRWTIGTLNRPANGTGGMVKGVELSGALDAGLLWAPLEGFGVTGSMSGTELDPSEWSGHQGEAAGPVGRGVQLHRVLREGWLLGARQPPLPFGVSRRGDRPVRPARLQRDLAERQIDLQVGYAIEEGTYKGLSFLFQVNNLNNSPYQTRQGDPFSGGSYAPERYTTYGRQILLGLNYKL
jgi:iron complex outermembrane receptor protein